MILTYIHVNDKKQPFGFSFQTSKDSFNLFLLMHFDIYNLNQDLLKVFSVRKTNMYYRIIFLVKLILLFSVI